MISKGPGRRRVRGGFEITNIALPALELNSLNHMPAGGGRRATGGDRRANEDLGRRATGDGRRAAIGGRTMYQDRAAGTSGPRPRKVRVRNRFLPTDVSHL
jgi:hypothetical protein